MGAWDPSIDSALCKSPPGQSPSPDIVFSLLGVVTYSGVCTVCLAHRGGPHTFLAGATVQGSRRLCPRPLQGTQMLWLTPSTSVLLGEVAQELGWVRNLTEAVLSAELLP